MRLGLVKEIKRVLKPNGIFLMVNEVYKDPKFEERNAKWANLLDMPLHTPDEYKDFLGEAGYHIISIHIDPNKNWITAIARL